MISCRGAEAKSNCGERIMERSGCEGREHLMMARMAIMQPSLAGGAGRGDDAMSRERDERGTARCSLYKCRTV